MLSVISNKLSSVFGYSTRKSSSLTSTTAPTTFLYRSSITSIRRLTSISNPSFQQNNLLQVLPKPSNNLDNFLQFKLQEIMESEKRLSCSRKWWKESVVYQIYPRSFKDSNNDGIGDLNGIISKLDHIANLGANVIWLSPVYQSPNDDNGYDISDYRAIHPDFGTMGDWERLLQEVHKRNMKLVMDLVLNHTSDEHEWFVNSRKSVSNPYRDFYIWKKPHEVTGLEPNNWVSLFGGSAWQLDETTGEYYLHLFSKKQPDLNWENPKVREEIQEIAKFWLDKGVDGFRMDVINMISKAPGLPDAAVANQEDMYHWAGEHFFNGPKFVEYMKEIKQKVFDKYDIFTVGETPCVTPEHGNLYTEETHGVLNMLFHFELMDVDTVPGNQKWEFREPPLAQIKKIMSSWQENIGKGWNSLYLENHDQPRSVSRFGDEGKYRVQSAKMLATWLHMMKGTPYVFQGQELGMINVKFDDIRQYNDLETINMYNEEMAKGKKTHSQIMEAIHVKSRDNARTPMPWNNQENVGFNDNGSPTWLGVNPVSRYINVQHDQNDPTSVFHYYQKLIKLRKENLIMVYGDYQLLLESHKQIYAYTRNLHGEQLVVIANFSKETATFDLPPEDAQKILKSCTSQELLISVYNDVNASQNLLKPFDLCPFEARVYRLTEE